MVFNPLSGDTHFLDIVSSELLRTIMTGTATRSQLCEHIAAFLDAPNSSDLQNNVAELVALLDELGLIEPAVGC